MKPLSKILTSVFLLLSILGNSCKKQEVPVVSTTDVTDINNNSATSGGVITDEGSGTVISRGICWSINSTPTISDNKTSDGAGAGSFVSALVGLNEATTYFVRAYATNEAGTGYGMTLSFSTLMSDFENNFYSTIKIGQQIWMKENLKTTKYNDGSSIPLVTSNSSWNNLTTGAYCWYQNDGATYKNTYGALYNWYSVSTGKLCPSGWHVPSDAEWTSLINQIGSTSTGGKLKETGLSHWSTPNTGATNESEFTGLPGGFRDPFQGGIFVDIGKYAYWWSSTSNDQSSSWYRALYYNSTEVLRNSFDNRTGFSVRCVKD